MGALMQISAVLKHYDSDGRPAADAASLTGRPDRAVAVMDLSHGEGSTQVPSGAAVAATFAAQEAGSFYLCGHCTSLQWRALSAQGWTIWPVPLAMPGLLRRVPSRGAENSSASMDC
jgi:hypothetical protein